MKNFVYVMTCLALSMLFVVSSCKRQNMEVFYISGAMEAGNPLEPDEFLGWFENAEAQEKIIPASTFDSIYYGFKKVGKKKLWNPNCRFCVTTAIGKVFIDNYFESFTKDSDSVSVSPRIIYLIRKYAGYYNRIPEEDLDYMYDSHYFDLHQDYKYSPLQQLDKSPLCDPRVKVIFFREE